jgi:hypothetical protein
MTTCPGEELVAVAAQVESAAVSVKEPVEGVLGGDGSDEETTKVRWSPLDLGLLT